MNNSIFLIFLIFAILLVFHSFLAYFTPCSILLEHINGEESHVVPELVDEPVGAEIHVSQVFGGDDAGVERVFESVDFPVNSVLDFGPVGVVLQLRDRRFHDSVELVDRLANPPLLVQRDRNVLVFTKKGVILHLRLLAREVADRLVVGLLQEVFLAVFRHRILENFV